MHQHHGALRLLIQLLGIFLVGLALYFLLVYGLSRHNAVSSIATSTPVTATSTSVGMATSSPGTTSTSTPSNPDTSTPAMIDGMQVVSQSDINTTVYLTKGQKFVIQL